MAMLVCSIPIVWRIAISVPLNSTTVYKDNIHGLYGQKQFVFTYIYLYIYIYTDKTVCVLRVYMVFSVFMQGLFGSTWILQQNVYDNTGSVAISSEPYRDLQYCEMIGCKWFLISH